MKFTKWFTEDTRFMTCPYCGYEDILGWGCVSDTGKARCIDCGKEFEYKRRIIEGSYYTRKIKKK
jgi:DNA-directed RNA polymerase subunit RPC12/RpoP